MRCVRHIGFAPNFLTSNIVGRVRITNAARAAAAGSTLLMLTSAAHAQVYIRDGSLENLTIGAAPDVGTPNGAWQFPQNYVTADVAETFGSEFSVTPDPVGGAAGKSLFLRNTLGPTWTGNHHLAGLFETPYVRDQTRRVPVFTFDAYFPQAGSGGAVYLGTGFESNFRGPQLSFIADGPAGAPMGVHSTGLDGQLTFLGSVARNQWTTFEISCDMFQRNFDLRVARRGLPLEAFANDRSFRGQVSGFDRVGIAAFSAQGQGGAFQGYFDNFNFQVVPSPGPVAVIALATIAAARRRRN